MEKPLDQAISENAAGPAKASDESGSMEQHSLPDQVAADRYLESKQASRKKGLPIKLAKISPPGAL